MQLNPVGDFVFLNLPVYFPFHNPSVSPLALVRVLPLSVFIFYIPLLCFLPPVSFIQFFSSFCFSSPARSPEFLNMCWKVDESCRDVLSLSLFLFLSISFFSSFILLLPSFLSPREKGEAQSNWIPPNSEGNVDST